MQPRTLAIILSAAVAFAVANSTAPTADAQFGRSGYGQSDYGYYNYYQPYHGGNYYEYSAGYSTAYNPYGGFPRFRYDYSSPGYGYFGSDAYGGPGAACRCTGFGAPMTGRAR